MEIKHFEELWEEAEEVTTPLTEEEIIKEIHYYLEGDFKKYFGRILFLLTVLSKSENINAYEALSIAMEEQKMDNNDPDDK